MFMMGKMVRALYPELKKSRENGYSLKVLARVFEESCIVITTDSLSTYLSKLAPTREEAQPRTARKGTSVPSPTVKGTRRDFQMKPDVTL